MIKLYIYVTIYLYMIIYDYIYTIKPGHLYSTSPLRRFAAAPRPSFSSQSIWTSSWVPPDRWSSRLVETEWKLPWKSGIHDLDNPIHFWVIWNLDDLDYPHGKLQMASLQLSTGRRFGLKLPSLHTCHFVHSLSCWFAQATFLRAVLIFQFFPQDLQQLVTTNRLNLYFTPVIWKPTILCYNYGNYTLFQGITELQMNDPTVFHCLRSQHRQMVPFSP